MRTLLSIIASVSILVCAGCASNSDGSAKSPWAAGATKSVAAKNNTAPAPVASAVAESAPDYPVAAAAATTEEGALLASYPALSQANREKALAEIASAKADNESLPVPEEGKARVVAYNVDCSLIQFDTASAFKAGERVVLSKSGAHALVKIISVSEGGRYVAEEVDGVVNAPTLVPGDEIDCTVWVDPEDIAAVAAAAEKAKQDSDDAMSAVDDEEEYSDEEEYEEEVYEEEEF